MDVCLTLLILGIIRIWLVFTSPSFDSNVMDKLSFANEVVNCFNAQGSNAMIQVALPFFNHLLSFFFLLPSRF